MNREKKRIETIYVCSPFRPESNDPQIRECELDNNIDRVHQACRMLASLGYMPLAPHGYFTNFLNDNDPKEREDGMELAMEWLELSDELWVFGKRISDGMAREIARATELGIPVRCMPEPGRLMENLLRAIRRGGMEPEETKHKEGAADGTETED